MAHEVRTSQARVEGSDPRRLEVLRAAAVLGEPIDDDILVDLLGEGVSDALEECLLSNLAGAPCRLEEPIGCRAVSEPGLSGHSR